MAKRLFEENDVEMIESNKQINFVDSSFQPPSKKFCSTSFNVYKHRICIPAMLKTLPPLVHPNMHSNIQSFYKNTPVTWYFAGGFSDDLFQHIDYRNHDLLTFYLETLASCYQLFVDEHGFISSIDVFLKIAVLLDEKWTVINESMDKNGFPYHTQDIILGMCEMIERYLQKQANIRFFKKGHHYNVSACMKEVRSYVLNILNIILKEHYLIRRYILLSGESSSYIDRKLNMSLAEIKDRIVVPIQENLGC